MMQCKLDSLFHILKYERFASTNILKPLFSWQYIVGSALVLVLVFLNPVLVLLLL